MIDLMDPTIPIARERIDYVARPTSLNRLRIGLIENTKKNSEAILKRIAQRLSNKHGMTLEVLVHKPQRAPLTDAQIGSLRGKVDFAITGIGD